MEDGGEDEGFQTFSGITFFAAHMEGRDWDIKKSVM